MAAHERRQALLGELRAATGPVSGGRLATRFGVSRQIIVGDISWLRATGADIVSTARGYVLMGGSAPDDTSQAGGSTGASHGSDGAATPATSGDMTSDGLVTRVIKAHHTVEDTSDELFCVLENGGAVLDVSVSHRVYGRISATLDIRTREDALRFIDGIASGKSSPMLTMTSGYHYHTIAARDEATLDRIERALDAKGYLAPLLPHER